MAHLRQPAVTKEICNDIDTRAGSKAGQRFHPSCGHDAWPRGTETRQAGQRHRWRQTTPQILRLLKRPGGASLAELTKATGWQAHSVRGFLSGAVKAKMRLKVISAKREDGERAYRVPA